MEEEVHADSYKLTPLLSHVSRGFALLVSTSDCALHQIKLSSFRTLLADKSSRRKEAYTKREGYTDKNCV